jgi:hypothetical protein
MLHLPFKAEELFGQDGEDQDAVNFHKGEVHPQLSFIDGCSLHCESPLPESVVEHWLITNGSVPENIQSVVQIDLQLADSFPNIRVKSETILLQTCAELCLVETCAFHVIDKLSIKRTAVQFGDNCLDAAKLPRPHYPASQ